MKRKGSWWRQLAAVVTAAGMLASGMGGAAYAESTELPAVQEVYAEGDLSADENVFVEGGEDSFAGSDETAESAGAADAGDALEISGESSQSEETPGETAEESIVLDDVTSSDETEADLPEAEEGGDFLIEEENAEEETEGDLINIHLSSSEDRRLASLNGSEAFLLKENKNIAWGGSYGAQLKSLKPQAYQVYQKMYQMYVTQGQVPSNDFTVTFNQRPTFPYSDGRARAVLDDIVLSAVCAFSYDYPEALYFGASEDWSWTTNSVYENSSTGQGYVTSVTVKVPYSQYANTSSKNTLKQNIASSVNTVKGWINGATDRFTKVRMIHDYLCYLLKYDDYDNESLTDHGLEGAFLKSSHLTVCEGYTKAFKVLCDRFGIPCVCIVGYADNDGNAQRARNTDYNHIWNYVRMENGKWYLVDVTWDDDPDDDWNPSIGFCLSGSQTKYDGSTPIRNVHRRTGVIVTTYDSISYSTYTTFGLPTLSTTSYVVISGNPSDKWCAKLGNSVTYGVAARGYNLKYNWQYKKTGGSWKNFASGNGKKTIACRMYNASFEGMKVRCVVTNWAGDKATTRESVMHFSIKAAITSQPKDATAYAFNAGLKVSVAAAGLALKYTWQYAWSGSSTWHSFSSGNGKASITVKMCSSRYDKIKVRCLVKDMRGTTLTTRTATLRLNVAPKITRQPTKLVSSGYGRSTYLYPSVGATGVGLKYSWQYLNSAYKWTAFASGNGKSSIRVTMYNKSYEGLMVRCVITDNRGRKLVSNAAMMSGISNPTGSWSQPKNVVSWGYGKNVVVTLRRPGSAYGFTWQYQMPGTSVWKQFAGGNGTWSIKVYMKDRSYNGIRVRCAVRSAWGVQYTQAATIRSYPLGSDFTWVTAAKNKATTIRYTGAAGAKYTWSYSRYTGSAGSISSAGWTKFTSSGISGATLKKTFSTTDKNGHLYVRCIAVDGKGYTVGSQLFRLR